jgi:predicted lipoprotein with Yx(FWY)xxD motif
MKYTTIALGLAAALLAGCGGGGGTMGPGGGGAVGGGGGIYGGPPIVQTPPPAMQSPPPQASAGPSAAPSTAPAGVLMTATINGGPAFITASQLPIYTFGGDTVANQSNCTGSCLTIWPAVPAPSGMLPAPFASFTRPDTGTVQLTYKGKPLYTFISDSQPLVATGDGVQNFHIARP